jgi:hypothetical protein
MFRFAMEPKMTWAFRESPSDLARNREHARG